MDSEKRRYGREQDGGEPLHALDFLRVPRTYSVVVADDNEKDVMHLRSALRQTKRMRIVHRCLNGYDAIDYLQPAGKYADREEFPFPDLLLLDLNMPSCDGFEVLQWLAGKSFPNLHVVVFSNRSSIPGMRRAVALGADYYQVTPATIEKWRELVILLERSCVLFQESMPFLVANGRTQPAGRSASSRLV